jgi:hypothetical protein
VDVWLAIIAVVKIASIVYSEALKWFIANPLGYLVIGLGGQPLGHLHVWSRARCQAGELTTTDAIELKDLSESRSYHQDVRVGVVIEVAPQGIPELQLMPVH